MPIEGSDDNRFGVPFIRTSDISARERYQLLTSLVVPRPIGWLSTYSRNGRPNIAPFSYFAAIADSPMLVAASIGHRRGELKDTIRNIRVTGAFCVNVVTERQLEKMNSTSGDYPPDVDEFEMAGLEAARAAEVDAPYVADCPAVMECRLFKELQLEGVPTSVIFGEVLAVRLDSELERVPGSYHVDTEALAPVGRLWAGAYALLGEIRVLRRPRVG